MLTAFAGVNVVGDSPMVVAAQRWPYVEQALLLAGLADTGPGRAALGLFQGPLSVSGVLGYALFALPAYLVGSLGLRLAGLWGMLGELRRGDPARSAWLVLALVALIGAPLTLRFSVTPAEATRATAYNETVWFMVLAKFAAWPFAVDALRRMLAGRPAAWRVAGAALVAGLALPSTVQFYLWQARHQPELTLDAESVAVIAELSARAAPGDVVIAPEPLAVAAMTLASCRAPVQSLALDRYAKPVELRELEDLRRRFWESWSGRGVDAALVRRFGARFVLAGRGAGAVPRSSRDGSLSFVPVHESPSYALHEVRSASP